MKPLSFQEVEKTLETAGFRVVRSNGGHFVWKNDLSGKSVPVPHHTKPIPSGLFSRFTVRRGCAVRRFN